MNLWQRIVNMYYYLRQVYEYLYITIPIQEKVSRKHFGDSVAPAHQLASNISLLLVAINPFLATPRANVPAIVYTGGFRATYEKKPLPQASTRQ